MAVAKPAAKSKAAKKPAVKASQGPKPWDATMIAKPHLAAVYVSKENEKLFYWRLKDAEEAFGIGKFEIITNPNHTK